MIILDMRKIETSQMVLENHLTTFSAIAGNILFTLNSVAPDTDIVTRMDRQSDIGDALPVGTGYNSFRASAQPYPLRATHLIASPFCTSS